MCLRMYLISVTNFLVVTCISVPYFQYLSKVLIRKPAAMLGGTHLILTLWKAEARGLKIGT